LQNIIDTTSDLFLRNSYSPHFTLGTRYAFIFSNQDIRKKKNFSYLRVGAEAAGNTLRGIFVLLDKNRSKDKKPLDFLPDTTFYPGPSWSIPFVKNYTIETFVSRNT